jgi:bifunctional UDP-N-acetylglucosamine pyrophosphorylase/glucosamine-1-phosphate N-acetyltransferase
VEGIEITGTGSSTRVAVEEIEKWGVRPDVVFVGYGDHMMFYTQEEVSKLEREIRDGAQIAFITTEHADPNSLRWGRIVRNGYEQVERIVEHKEATPEELEITELNGSLYAFEWKFLKEQIMKIKPATVSGEYYLTDLVGMAIEKKETVVGVKVPFERIGYGINTQEELKQAEELFLARGTSAS